MWEDFTLKILFFAAVILWSILSIGIFLLLVRLGFIWFGDFEFFGIFFSPA